MIINIMFNMILKFAHYLCNWQDFWILAGFVTLGYVDKANGAIVEQTAFDDL